jgi:hypothetical protein
LQVTASSDPKRSSEVANFFCSATGHRRSNGQLLPRRSAVSPLRRLRVQELHNSRLSDAHGPTRLCHIVRGLRSLGPTDSH